MVTLKDILEAEPHQAVLLRTQWKEVRGLLPTTGVPNDVMRYIEELEARIDIMQKAIEGMLRFHTLQGYEEYSNAKDALMPLQWGTKEPT